MLSFFYSPTLTSIHDYWKNHQSHSQFSRSIVSESLWPHEPQHTRPPCPLPIPGVYPNSCPLSQWCYPTISSSAVPFSSYPQAFSASGSFPMSQFFTSVIQRTGASSSSSVLPMNIQGWFPLGLTDLILLSKGLSRVFSNTLIWKHQFFGAQCSWKNHRFNYTDLCQQTDVSAL